MAHENVGNPATHGELSGKIPGAFPKFFQPGTGNREIPGEKTMEHSPTKIFFNYPKLSPIHTESTIIWCNWANRTRTLRHLRPTRGFSDPRYPRSTIHGQAFSPRGSRWIWRLFVNGKIPVTEMDDDWGPMTKWTPSRRTHDFCGRGHGILLRPPFGIWISCESAGQKIVAPQYTALLSRPSFSASIFFENRPLAWRC